MKKVLTLVILVLMLGLISAAMIGCEAEEEVEEGRVVVSSKTFPEALTQGWMTYYLLQDRGYDVVNEIGLGEVAVIRPALEAGEIDLYWEYTGTGLMNVMGYDAEELPGDEQETFQIIHDYDLEENNIKWLDYVPANNTFVLFVTSETQQEYGWETLSDLAEYARAEGGGSYGSIATPAEWVERDDGMIPFQDHYDFEFADVVEVELGLAYRAVEQGEALIGVGDATEGRIIKYDLYILDDDLDFFPAYNAAPTIRMEVLEANPELEDILRELSSLLDLETQIELNLRTAVDEEDPEDVAWDFLVEQGLIDN